jgi:hypothetical protein
MINNVADMLVAEEARSGRVGGISFTNASRFSRMRGFECTAQYR